MALGGIREARVPPAATTPAASRWLYPYFSISGIATRENTAAVAVDAPETAAVEIAYFFSGLELVG